MLDNEDYENMEIMSKIHRRKIEVELRRIFQPKDVKGINMNEEHAIKREKIRKAKIYMESATFLQRVYRGYRARSDIWNMKEVERVMRQEAQRKELTQASNQWWLERTGTYRLPPVKEFGRKRDHLSCQGWGRWEPGGVWKALESLDDDGNQVPYSDSNVSRSFSEGLSKSGYDRTRT